MFSSKTLLCPSTSDLLILPSNTNLGEFFLHLVFIIRHVVCRDKTWLRTIDIPLFRSSGIMTPFSKASIWYQGPRKLLSPLKWGKVMCASLWCDGLSFMISAVSSRPLVKPMLVHPMMFFSRFFTKASALTFWVVGRAIVVIIIVQWVTDATKPAWQVLHFLQGDWSTSAAYERDSLNS